MDHNELSGDLLWETSQPLTKDLSKIDPNPPVPYLIQNPSNRASISASARIGCGKNISI